jgi:hypothetical protein
MSEVIVRMEKFPTKCIDCKMWSICEALNKAMADDQDLFASRLFHKTEHGFTKPADCPIKGVLPDEHGDLIDRDAYLKLLESYIESKRGICENKEIIVALQAISKQIKCVKAVISATERSET